jgi:hypothetical protein
MRERLPDCRQSAGVAIDRRASGPLGAALDLLLQDES